MKSIYLLSAALLMASAAPAVAKTQNDIKSSPLTGAYLGVYGGYDWSGLDTNVAGLDSDVHGWDGGVFAGYKFDHFIGGDRDYGIGANAAIEAFYGVSNSDDTVGGIRVEKDNEWGVSFRPGLSVLGRMTGDLGLNPYGILGYRNTEFDASAGAISGSERYDGFELGIGTEVVAFGNIGVRVEYSHVWYGEEGNIDPDADDLRLGVSYHF